MNSALIRFDRVMPPKLRATQHLSVHNVGPEWESQKRSWSKLQWAEVRRESSKGSHHDSSPKKECCSKSKSSSRSDSPDNTPLWAKKLLEVHERSEECLQFLKKELKSRPFTERSHTKLPQPEFKYKRNKIQYELNEKVLDKLDMAASTSDEKAWNDALEEGRKSLKERNRHMLAEKYSWEAVNCYVQEPLACDSDDEKRIRWAVKESKTLKAESKKYNLGYN